MIKYVKEIANCSECEYPNQVIVLEETNLDGTITKKLEKIYYCSVCKTELRIEDIYV
jgi:hypothetical protein